MCNLSPKHPSQSKAGDCSIFTALPSLPPPSLQDWTTSTGAQMAQSPLEEKNQARGSPRSMVTAEHFQSAHFNMRTLPR